ncbi:FAD-dependent monooxygenase [Synechococcus sp. A10-1-5-1]|uniref:FAD-dependent monooxygenase n=1 Tax=Synechococcus sp. A10-1-5-1 TaxID=2936507 RepID=UPI0020008901|nr:FAD-dependent monooxygenase [Synechococcus sp. A10-1-5-1]UPM50783.1 FAD-dependent monooxygenase [Synechococcus sp. A10-1-5-1]
MTPPPRFIVVGAGPAGLSLALKLAEGGAQVELIEASERFSRQFRGDALMPSGQEALARMGLLPLLEHLPQRPLEGWSVWLERERLFQVAEPLGSLQPCRLVPQKTLLEALLERALRCPTLHWRPGQAVRRVVQRGARISGVELSNGEQLEADLVIGCDGRGSLLRQQAGIQLRTSGKPLELLWFELPGPIPKDCVWGFQTLVAGGRIGSACLNASGQLQLAWLLRKEDSAEGLNAEAWAERLETLAPEPLAQLLRERGNALSAPVRFKVQVGMAERWWQPGLLLLGDAAHPMSPVRAQGINLALRDSAVAAEQLLAGQNLDTAAETIERRRRPEVNRLQSLQLAEARQGHWIGSTDALRHGLALSRGLMGPIARRVWMARQRPLRDGLPGQLPKPKLLAP